MNDCDDCNVFDPREFFIGSSSIESTPERQTPVSSGAETSRHVSPIPEVDANSQDLSNYVAIGALRLQDTNGSSRSPPSDLEVYHHKFTTPLFKQGWIVTQRVEHIFLPGYASLRVFVLPEDVGRQYRRGSMSDFRRALKSLLKDIDVSDEAWNATYLRETPVKTYNDISEGEESLFYIFNTLPSPHPSALARLDKKTKQAITDINIGSIQGLNVELYSYQKRSANMMIQRETSPTKSLDPRKPSYTDLCGRQFYLDTYEGIILKEPHLYDEPRGGILAETMGYGKTVICLAVILATRGHLPVVPDDRIEIIPAPREKTASLLKMAAAAAARKAIPWKAEFHALSKAGFHYERCVEELKKHVKEYDEPIFHPTNPSRKGKRTSKKIVRLCSATLVIVPPNILMQWRNEITRHTEPGALDLLVIDLATKFIPEWQELIKYDIIMITKARFEQEYRDNDLHIGKRGRGEEVFQSPLTDVRWLRVICDEGHGFAFSGSRTNAMAMLDKLYVERRWVVSGTPSNSMLGVEVSMAANETDNAGLDRATTLKARRSSDTADQEARDLEKLRALVADFLKVRPWANKETDIANWNRYVAARHSSEARRRGASLRVLLQSLIVRHRIEDIDIDLCLPPLHNKVVYLEPSYYDKLSINLFVLVLISNAITSERTDEDYMFHPKNRKTLDVLIGNLRQSSFHWVGFRQHDVEEALRVSNAYLDENLDTISDTDGMLLTEALMVGQRALIDAGWKAFSNLHEIGVYVESFPEHASQAWSIHGEYSNPLLLGTVQARQAQQHVRENLSAEDPCEGLVGAGLRAMQAVRNRAAEENETVNKTRAESKIVEEPRLKQHTSPVRLRIPVHSASPKNHRLSLTTPVIDPGSSLSKAHILGFSSAKLTYLADAVLTYSPTEKIIIFYDGNNVAFWIAEALEMLHVSFRIYASTLTVAKRAEYLAAFNSLPQIRVLLMDLKQAAHGLHVAVASRVYIVNPIWQPSVESQAIKRAHRIGQTKPVFVETIVLRDTLEDRMLKRRKQMSNAELVKAEKSLLDDGTMGQILKDERFLKFKPGEESVGGQFARLRVPKPFFGGVQQDEGFEPKTRASVAMEDVQGMQAKKRKVTFRAKDV